MLNSFNLLALSACEYVVSRQPGLFVCISTISAVPCEVPAQWLVTHRKFPIAVCNQDFSDHVTTMIASPTLPPRIANPLKSWRQLEPRGYLFFYFCNWWIQALVPFFSHFTFHVQPLKLVFSLKRNPRPTQLKYLYLNNLSAKSFAILLSQ